LRHSVDTPKQRADIARKTIIVFRLLALALVPFRLALKAAKQIGVTIPPNVLARADTK
jgi:hypothetical protein